MEHSSPGAICPTAGPTNPLRTQLLICTLTFANSWPHACLPASLPPTPAPAHCETPSQLPTCFMTSVKLSVSYLPACLPPHATLCPLQWQDWHHAHLLHDLRKAHRLVDAGDGCGDVGQEASLALQPAQALHLAQVRVGVHLLQMGGGGGEKDT